MKLPSFLKVLTLYCLLAFNFAEAKEKAIVVVIDTGLDLQDPRFTDILCKTGHRDFTGTGIQDNHGHGTHVAGLIKKYAKSANYCFVILKFSNGRTGNHIPAMRYLFKIHPAVVNLSLQGGGFNEDEYITIKSLSNTKFIVAAGNGNVDLTKKKIYPAIYGATEKNVITVGGLGENAEKYSLSNYGPFLKWEAAENIVSTCPNQTKCTKSGTSMATAIHTGKYVEENFK